MMKNKKMGILAVLVMLVAVTFNAVGGTYAKYVSAFDLADEARVAQWKFDFTGTDEDTTTAGIQMDLFKDSYQGSEAGTDVVSSESGIKVVAPGTFGEYTFKLAGNAETNYTVTVGAEIENEIVDGDYNPIFFRLDNGDWMNSDDFETELESLYSGKVFGANTGFDKTHKIEWVWAFDTASDADSTKTKFGADNMPEFTTDDEKDTALAQAKEDGSYRNITVDITLTVTQSELDAN